jgi:hypothetical protein
LNQGFFDDDYFNVEDCDDVLNKLTEYTGYITKSFGDLGILANAQPLYDTLAIGASDMVDAIAVVSHDVAVDVIGTTVGLGLAAEMIYDNPDVLNYDVVPILIHNAPIALERVNNVPEVILETDTLFTCDVVEASAVCCVAATAAKTLPFVGASILLAIYRPTIISWYHRCVDYIRARFTREVEPVIVDDVLTNNLAILGKMWVNGPTPGAEVRAEVTSGIKLDPIAVSLLSGFDAVVVPSKLNPLIDEPNSLPDIVVKDVPLRPNPLIDEPNPLPNIDWSKSVSSVDDDIQQHVDLLNGEIININDNPLIDQVPVYDGNNDGVDAKDLVASHGIVIRPKRPNNNYGTLQNVNFDTQLAEQFVPGSSDNPHELSALKRKMCYAYVNNYLKANNVKYIKDLFGNARTPNLLDAVAVHVHREVVTLKDYERADLISKKKEFTYLTKKNAKQLPAKQRPTWCKHLFSNCYCLDKADGKYFFLNDVYYANIYQDLHSWPSTRDVPIIVVMKVFDDNYLGGRIVVNFGDNVKDEGEWYRNKFNDMIVYSPLTNEFDTERHYVHPNIFSELFRSNKHNYCGYEFTVLHREIEGACATVIVIATPNKSDQKITGKKFVYYDQGYYGGSADDVTRVRALYEHSIVPTQATVPYTHDAWLQHCKQRSRNVVVDDLRLQLNVNKDGHVHFCDSCGSPYWHTHKLPKNFHSDAGSMAAKHPQFSFDCPYTHCTKYNHVDCTAQCNLPHHADAVEDLQNYCKNTARLSNDKLAIFLNSTVKLLDNDIHAVIPHTGNNYSKSQLQAAVLNIPGDPGDVVKNVPKPFNHMMSKAMNVLLDGHFYDMNPITKNNEVYTKIQSLTGHLKSVSATNTGTLLFSAESEEFVIPDKTLNRIMNQCVGKQNSDDVYTLIARQVTCATEGYVSPGMVTAVTQFIVRDVIHRIALIGHLKHSAMGHYLNDALDGKVLPYDGFFSACRMFGFRRAVRLWFTTLNFCGCNTGDVNVAELRFNLPLTQRIL